MEITITERDYKGFAIAKEDSSKAGAMTFSKASNELIIIDHNEVEPKFKGGKDGHSIPPPPD